MEIPTYVDEHGQRETMSWQEFIYKAANGSSESFDVIYMAEATLVALKTSTGYSLDYTYDDVHDLLNPILGNDVPYSTFQEFLDKLFEAGMLTKQIRTRSKPLNPRRFYHDLWNSDKAVDENALMHDAALYCYKHWGIQTFAQLMKVKNDGLTFNSRNVVSIMIFIAYCYFEDR